MPHKHTRKGEDQSTIDLPPTVIAKPLSVSKSAASNGIFTTDPKRTNKKRKRNKDTADDTPKAFARLMAFQAGKKLPKGLDDGIKLSKSQRKKAKIAAEAETDGGPVEKEKVTKKKAVKEEETNEVPTIRIGEKMSSFSARVDQALPISGLINKTAKNGKDPLGLKVGRTKTEKRMHKMYAEWREQDAKIKEKREEQAELAEEEAMDSDGQVKWKVDIDAAKTGAGNGKKKKKGKGKKKMLGEVDDGDDDPWAVVKRNRAEGKVGLHDVALAPPSFSKVPREKLQARVVDVPRESGSLRRREELGEVRLSVVEGYRAMMKAGKTKGARDGEDSE